MWNEIKDSNDIYEFMERIIYFHDSCIKEIKYVSGAYVNENLSMRPINESRVLSVIFQRQFKDISMIELQFEGIDYLKLFPNNENYTCEILDSSMFMFNNRIYWADSEDVSSSNFESYDGTLICASKLRWRAIEGCIGDKDYFVPVTQERI